MGKGDDPNCQTAATATMVAASERAADLAAQIGSDNPNLTETRLRALPGEIDKVLGLPQLRGKQILFLHLSGSMAYGLAHDESDHDVRGVYLADTTDLLGLRATDDNISPEDQDLVIFELRKFILLAAEKAGPQQLECLYAPSLHSTPAGEAVLGHRDLFLSQRVRRSYGGFAMGEMRALEKHESSGHLSLTRRAKSIRHMIRLMEQAVHLLATGEMRQKVDDPERYARWETASFERIASRWQELDERLRTVRSVLPEIPDMRALNDMLVSLRLQALNNQ